MFDSHIHLDQLSPAQRAQTLCDARLTGLLAVSMDLAGAQQLLRLKRRYPQLRIAAGYHPEQPLPNAADEAALWQWISANRAELTAIGEVGLPHYLKRTNPALDYAPYIALFERFILLAKRLNLPLNLHIVHDDVAIALDLLAKHQIGQAHFHWFKTDEKLLARFLASPYMASVTPDILWNSKTQKVAQTLPLERLMIETDSPWPHDGLEQAGIAEQLEAVCRQLAQLKGLAVHAVKAQLARNSQRFYRG